MINRRSTPSGDGRGRGRTGGSDRSAGRGGRPAFRTERDDRGYGGRTGGGRGERSYGDRDRGFGGDRDRGYASDGRSSRDSLRADRSGARSRYGRRDGDGEGRYTRENRPASRPEGRYGNRSEGRSEGRYGNRSEGRSESRYEGRSEGRSGSRYEGRSGSRYASGDRERGSWSRGDRDTRDARGDRPARPARDDRYGRDDRPARGDRYDRGPRPEYTRSEYDRGTRSERPRGEGFGRPRGDRDADRGGYRSDRYERSDRRDDRAGSRPERRDDRGDYRSDRRDDRRDDRRGHGSDRRDDRGGFRADRGGRREDAASRDTSATRSRYGRRDGDAPRAAVRATGRGTRRDDVQTVGRIGRPDRPDRPARPAGTATSRGPGSPQQDRIKAARQPIRDRDLYPEGYTDERDTTEVPDGVRLQKVLAQAGVASRRACEEMIGDGRVTVDGQVVRRFGAKVDPAKQVIHVDGKRVPTAPDLVYYALNKPIGVVSTMDDPQGRPCLADYVQELAPRLFHVGRLDTETEGLLLLTNDGELANRLTHPSYGVQKKYWAKVPGPIPKDLGRRLKQGIELEDGIVRADSFTIVQEHGQQALVEVVLHEGRKHIVRRMLEEAGHRVIDLARIEFGPVKLGRTKPGTFRALTLKEVGELYAAVKL
ncbi:pseudouridine synthase [Nonomuraea sp. NPDC050783]|uniref:pseudouridine synthase n=1 Tax=Nonomuraea sp. NPDC050783 TaxID=3154634 RepID=UPI0034672327